VLASRFAGFDRIDAFAAKPSTIKRFLSCLLQIDRIERAEAHFAGFPAQHVPVNPAFGGLAISRVHSDLEIKAAAVGMEAGRLEPGHLQSL
jgi:hypothetical protein